MAAYVVMEPPGGEKAEDATLVRDGFSWLAFVVPPLWLLWHRLWIEALLAFIVLGALSAVGEMLDLGLSGSLLIFLVALYTGLEGAALRITALRRHGWREGGVIEADTIADADTRYALGTKPNPVDEAAMPRIVPDAVLARPAQTGLALGLSHTPGRS